MGSKNESSQVVNSSTEWVVVVARKDIVGQELSTSVETQQPDQLVRMTQAYKTDLLTADLTVSELTFNRSTISASGAVGQRTGSYRVVLVDSGRGSARSVVEKSARQLGLLRGGSVLAWGRPSSTTKVNVPFKADVTGKSFGSWVRRLGGCGSCDERGRSVTRWGEGHRCVRSRVIDKY